MEIDTEVKSIQISNEIITNDVSMPGDTTTSTNASNSDTLIESESAGLQPSETNAKSHMRTPTETPTAATTIASSVAHTAADINSYPKQDDTSAVDHSSEAIQSVDSLKSSLSRGPMTPPGEPVASLQTNPAPNNHPSDESSENCVSSSGDVAVSEILNPAEQCSNDVIPTSNSGSVTSPGIVDRHIESNVSVSTAQNDLNPESTNSQSYDHSPNLQTLPSSTTTTATTMVQATTESKPIPSASPSDNNNTNDLSQSLNLSTSNSIQESKRRESECEINGVDPIQKSSDHIEPNRNDKTFNESREVHDAKRKFRIVGLTFPGKWMNHEKLMEIFVKSESFHIWFDKAEKGGIKSGGVSVVFENAEEAKMAFGNLQKMTLDGAPFKLQASRHFYVNQQSNNAFVSTSSAPSATIQTSPSLLIPFKVDINQSDAPRRLYALHLTPSTDQTLLSSILGSESIESIQLETDPIATSERQAEIVFRSADEANDARIELADGFEIDEGDRQSTMVLLTAEEYLAYMKEASEKLAVKAIPSTPSTSQRLPSSSTNVQNTSPTPHHTAFVSPSTGNNLFSHSTATTAPQNIPSSSDAVSTDTHPTNQQVQQSVSMQFIPAPEITVEDVTEYLQKYIDEMRINWAELSEVGELWKLCDDVSQEHKGIPDSLLKPALLGILELHLRSLPNHWMRRHIENLIKIWKPEVQNTKSAPRANAYVLSAVEYSPPAVSSSTAKRYSQQTDAKKRTLTIMMGMGALLNAARSKLATEEGEVDIDEDEYGNYTIDGQPLTFDSWADLTKQSESTATAEAPRAAAPPIMLSPKSRKIRNQHRKEIRAKKMEEIKIKKMREGLDEEVVGGEDEPEEEKCLEGDGNARKEITAPEEAVSSVVAGNGPEIPEKKRELEEGEMSSESSSSSSATSPSSSSSSSDDNDDEQSQNTARDRRRKRRIQKKRARVMATAQFSLGTAQSPHFEALFKKLYEHRRALLRSLSATHKHAFASVLNQILSSPQGMTRAQHDQMALFMRTFSAQSMHSK